MKSSSGKPVTPDECFSEKITKIIQQAVLQTTGTPYILYTVHAHRTAKAGYIYKLPSNILSIMHTLKIVAKTLCPMKKKNTLLTYCPPAVHDQHEMAAYLSYIPTLIRQGRS
jgi:hypothetical protein